MRLLQAQKTKGKSTNYQSFFILLAPRHSDTFDFVISLVYAPRHTSHIHTYTYTYLHIAHIHAQGKGKLYRDCIRAITHCHTSVSDIECRDMHVTPNMRPNPKVRPVRARNCENRLLWLQQTPPSEAKLMRASCLLCCCLGGTAYVQPVYVCAM